MKRFVSCGVLTALFFPAIWGVMNGWDILSGLFFNDTRFTILVCVVAGLNAMAALWAMREISRWMPPATWEFWMGAVAPLVAGLTLVTEGLLMVQMGLLRDLDFAEWFYVVEAPEFFALFVAYMLVARLMGNIVPYQVATPQEQETDNPVARQYRLRGAWFQLPMILLFGYRAFLALPADASFKWSSSFQLPALGVGSVLGFGGIAIMLIAMHRIYRQASKGPRKLITTDMFALTRHPMYHGMFLADLPHFFKGADLYGPFWWLTSIVFWVLLFTAGWYQEKETLARWGAEAERYYARTPRFIFEWLWFWKVREGRSA